MDSRLNLSNLFCDREPVPPSPNMPEEGERVLALYQGEWIVLEVGVEYPTYEENFKAFKYWFEPFNDMLVIEWDDVDHWQYLPDLI